MWVYRSTDYTFSCVHWHRAHRSGCHPPAKGNLFPYPLPQESEVHHHTTKTKWKPRCLCLLQIEFPVLHLLALASNMILFKNNSENWKDSTIRDVIQQRNVECWSDLPGVVPAGYGLELSWPQLKWDQTISRCFTCNKVGFCERELARNLCITQAIPIITFPSLFTWYCTESEYALLLLSACFCPVAAHPSRSWATSFLSVSSGRICWSSGKKTRITLLMAVSSRQVPQFVKDCTP